MKRDEGGAGNQPLSLSFFVGTCLSEQLEVKKNERNPQGEAPSPQVPSEQSRESEISSGAAAAPSDADSADSSDIVKQDDSRNKRMRERSNYPELAAPAIPQKDAITIARNLDAQLAEIDENLVRNELNALERGEQLARRKGLYEAKHPQTKQGARGRGSEKHVTEKDAESAPLSFTKDTAAKTSQSARPSL